MRCEAIHPSRGGPGAGLETGEASVQVHAGWQAVQRRRAVWRSVASVCSLEERVSRLFMQDVSTAAAVALGRGAVLVVA